MTSRAVTIAVTVVAVGVGVIVTAYGGPGLVAILLGWIPFLHRVLPQATVDWPSFAVGIVALALFAFSVHLAGTAALRKRNLSAETSGSWSLRVTAAVVALVFLLFGSGIALVGGVHQAIWLVNSREAQTVEASTYYGGTKSSESLFAIGASLSAFEGSQGRLRVVEPFTPDGRLLHGWELAALSGGVADTSPIDRTRPWNDPANAKYFKCIIPIFLNPELVNAPVVDDEGYGLSHYAANVRVYGPAGPMRISEVTDGAANTIAVGEVNDAFQPWGHPVNWRDPAKGVGGGPNAFGGANPRGGALVGMLDGHVRYLSPDVDPVFLRALATPAEGDHATSLPTQAW